jgi:hypothetical protein
MINSRKKGHDFERAVVAEFRALGWIRACRNIETDPDAVLGIDLKHTEPYAVQCKRLSDYAPIRRIEEIPPLPGQTPILITKPDDGPAMVVLPLSAFLTLISPDHNPRPQAEDF